MSGTESLYTVVLPVYRNAGSIPELLEALAELDTQLDGRLEAVFVVDGSPDDCLALLTSSLPGKPFRSQLLAHSRNFGSFAAIRTGLGAGSGPFYAVMAADLQEPPELVGRMFAVLEAEEADIAVGQRTSRDDPLFSRLAARLFWGTYRRLVQREVPSGGVDIFGINRAVRDQMLRLEESNTSLVGLLFWLGFRRRLLPYERLPRRHGKSAWTWKRKVKYLMDSMFGFSDLPIRMLLWTGGGGMLISVGFMGVVLVSRLMGWISEAGYAAIIVTITFLGALNAFALGLIGSYVWRAFENTKGRPHAVVMQQQVFDGAGETKTPDSP